MSSENGTSSNSGCGGCLSAIFMLFIICFVISKISSCGKDDNSQNNIQQTAVEETVVDTDTDASDEEIDSDEAEKRSPEALTIENLLFHRLYTDLGTVEIHNFKQRGEALEWLVTNCTDKDLFSKGYPVKLAKPFLRKSYYYCTSGETDLYYIGDVKDNRPDGFGAVLGVSTGSGTYDLKGGGLFYYLGNFKEGMMDGYGIQFAADEADISLAVLDAVQIMQDQGKEFSEDTLEKLSHYLFDYVSYEGYLKENKKHGKGNTFGFYWDDSGAGDVIRFVGVANPPLEGYLFGPVYPNVTKGEYRNDKLSGSVKIYKSNHIVYDGKMRNGEKNGKGTLYYNNGQIEYEGKFKNGAFHGRGTKYDFDGTETYSGKWENGDYAH